MSFFSAIGKILKHIPVVGNAIGIAEGVVEAGGSLLHHKQPMSKPITMPRVGGISTASILTSSPVMPGGAYATPQGVMASGGGLPPMSYGRGSRRRTSKRRATTSRRARYARGRSRSSKRKSGTVTYKGRRYTAKQARIFVPSHRR